VAAPREITIQSLKDFTEEVEKGLEVARTRSPSAKLPGNWYRGHGRGQTFKLVPGLYRHETITKLPDLLNLEYEMLEEFHRQSVLHDARYRVSEQVSGMEKLFYMQHYGVPTRLLDWTANPFIGLYFALTNAKKKPTSSDFEEDAAVWLLDPVSWNRKALEDLAWDDKGPALPTEQDLKSYYPQRDRSPAELKAMYEYPVAILGAANSSRMFAQKGVFTVFGKKQDPIEKIYDKDAFPVDCLQKIIVPKDRIEHLLSTLLSVGYTDSVSFPDLFGLAMEIKRMKGFRVSN
jgi:hypothetical protein